MNIRSRLLPLPINNIDTDQIRSPDDLHREREAWKRTIEVLDQNLQHLSGAHQDNDVAEGKKARTAGNA